MPYRNSNTGVIPQSKPPVLMYPASSEDSVIWNNLRDDDIEGWYIVDGEEYAIAHDKSPNSFNNRGLSEPIKVSDLPQAYLEAYALKWERPLTDEKLQWIWEFANINDPDPEGREVVLDIDPFYFLAILAAEGTGSFNTNIGQPQENFEIDIWNAAYIISRELINYREAGSPGDWLQWINIGNANHIDPDTDEFITTYVPEYKVIWQNGGVKSGGYAEHLHWWENVRRIYNTYFISE